MPGAVESHEESRYTVLATHPGHTLMLRYIPLMALLAGWLLPAHAMAHGGDPLPRELFALEQEWVLSTNFGIIRESRPSAYVCEEAFLGGDNFLIEPLGASSWVTFSDTHIMRTQDGCDFEIVMNVSKIPVATDSIPSRGLVVMLTNQQGIAPVHISRDAGASFAPLELSLERELQWTGMGLIDEQAAYLSAYSREEPGKGGALLYRVSLLTGELSLIAGLETTRYPYIFDVSGDTMAGLTNTDAGIALFWGQPERLQTRQLESWPTGMSLSTDGETLYASAASPTGGVLKGMWSAGEPVYEMIQAGHSARCVTQADEALYLCARRDREGHDLSRVTGGELEAVLNFEGLMGPDPACSPQSNVGKTCGVVWPELARALRLEPTPPAMMDQREDAMDMAPPLLLPDMAADMASADMSARGQGAGGGCASAQAPWPSGQEPLMFGLLCLGLWRRGKRRERA